ncbi:trigger factor [Fagus crenata]
MKFEANVWRTPVCSDFDNLGLLLFLVLRKICIYSLFDLHEYHPAVCAVISGAEDVGVSSSQFDDFSVAATSTCKARELKISFEVFGAKTQAIFDNVSDTMVTAAQPIPGFRRAKGAVSLVSSSIDHTLSRLRCHEKELLCKTGSENKSKA